MPLDYGLADLAALSDVSVRTIRFYLAQGLLPSPGREGPQTRYPESTLHRLQLIRQLQRGHLPLAEIRNRIAGLDDHDVLALLSEPAAPPTGSALDYVRGVLAGGAVPRHAVTSPSAPPPSMGLLKRIDMASSAPLLAASASPSQPAPGTPTSDRPQPERSQWERIELEPDIELHVRRPLSRIANKRVDRLIAFAQQLRKEDEK